MLFSEKIHYLKSKVYNYPNESINWLFNKINKPDNKFVQVTTDMLTVGKFYFARYDMRGFNKSSKMEQFVPFLMVDYKPAIDSKVVYIMNLNFLPLNTKEVFFSTFLDKNNSIIEKNSEKKNAKIEQPLPNIGYKIMYSELLKYGFEYSIREMRVELFNDIYQISTDNIERLITLNTQALTGVDEDKLQEIWVSKIKNESLENRVQDILEIKSNYEKIVNELAEKFKNLNKKLNE